MSLPLSLRICLSVCLSTYLSICLSTYLSSVYLCLSSVYLCLSLSIFVYLQYYLSLSIYIYLYHSLSTSFYLYLSISRIYQSINLSMAQSINLPIYQSMILEHIRLCMHTPSIMVPNALSVSFFPKRKQPHETC